jgi:hypothetical protein
MLGALHRFVSALEASVVLALCAAVPAAVRAQAPLPLYEPFDSPTGNLVGRMTGGTAWTRTGSNSAAPIQITTDSLAYGGLPARAGGKVSLLNGSSYEDAGLDIAGQSSGAVYASFILNVVNAGNTTGDFFFHFSSAGAGAQDFHPRVLVRQGSSAAKFVVGLRNSTSDTPVWTSGEYDVGTPVLVAVGYIFQPDLGDDLTRLWVNPPLGGAAPPDVPDAQSAVLEDLTTLGRIGLRQGSGDTNLNVQVDELRVSTSWSDVALLPVTLSAWAVE